MDILFLNHNVKDIGTYIRCFNFAKHLVQFGHSVTILTSAPQYILFPRKYILEGVKVVCHPDIFGKRIRNGGLGLFDTFLRCLYILRRQFDIVENYDHRPAVLYPALVSKYLCRIPLVSEWTDLHGSGGSLSNRPKAVQRLIRPYEDFTEKQSKKLPAKLVVISQGLKQKALSLGVPESKICYIPGGADLEKIKMRPKIEVRKKFGLPIDKKIIAYTAGTQYNLDFLIKAINLIQIKDDRVNVLTTGAIMHPKDREKIKDPGRILELGFLSYADYTTVLSAADIFIFPFRNQPLNTGRWPNKIGDYMAAGRPTVTNRTGDLIRLFDKHQIGHLASDDPDDFAGKTLDILSNESLALTLGQNARRTAEKHYDWKVLAKKLEACFSEVRQQADSYQI